MHVRIWLVASLLASALLSACQATSPAILGRPVHTFSIVARDPRTGELGVAVQSHWFSVGTVVTWAEAGVGAVATQSFAEPAYGPRALDLMRTGVAAPDALAALLAADAGREVRQVAIVDSEGRVAAHTGSKCIDWAGHKTGASYSCQANLMIDDVVTAMSRAYESANGDLAERLMQALEAAQAAGGDIRGKQSAALLVVKAQSSGRPWADRVVDLRVEDNPEPLRELRRLLVVQRAYEHMNAGDQAVEKKDMEAALREYGAAMQLVPDNLEMRYWTAVALASNGRIEEALPLFRAVFAGDKNWIELTRRLPKAELLSREIAEKVLAGAAPTR